MYDLAKALISFGNDVVVIRPYPLNSGYWSVDRIKGVTVLSLYTVRFVDVSYFRRLFAEVSWLFTLGPLFKSSPMGHCKFDLIVCYSPSVFLVDLCKQIKEQNSCKLYLVLRDFFPQWLLDLRLISDGLLFRWFSKIAIRQVHLADVVGVQTESSVCRFRQLYPFFSGRLEVLHNWLADRPMAPSEFNLAETKLAGRRIFVYLGNLGVAQNPQLIVGLVRELAHRTDIGFVIVGRGEGVTKLRETEFRSPSTNLLVLDEIEPEEVPALLSQCYVGIVSLDHRHTADNIPGKFLSYVNAGLPVLANVNRDSDLMRVIDDYRIGYSCSTDSSTDFSSTLLRFFDNRCDYNEMRLRARYLALNRYRPEVAASQVLRVL